MNRLFFILLLVLYTMFSYSQEKVVSQPDTLRKDALNVYFVDNASSFIKKEVPFINYVRDRQVADLIIISTRQSTGSGGREYTYFIEGQKEYAGENDTIIYHTNIAEGPTDKVKYRQANALKMGLMKYIMHTPLAEYININFSAPISNEIETDKFNSWVFSTGLRGSLRGNKSSKRKEYQANFNARKVTDKWKLNFSFNYKNRITEYNYEDVIAKNTTENSGISGDVIKSLGNHWGLGVSIDAISSIYSNYDLALSFNPAIEYNFYPYSESTRRQFTLFYIIGARYNNYSDTTQFLKTEEFLGSQRFQASYTSIQSFGKISAHARWSNYLHDFALNNLSLGIDISINITKGLNFWIEGKYKFIHDQVSLRKGTASVEDVLLNQQELSTTFSYEGGIGFSYSFGSIYNNAVNQRLSVLF